MKKLIIILGTFIAIQALSINEVKAKPQKSQEQIATIRARRESQLETQQNLAKKITTRLALIKENVIDTRSMSLEEASKILKERLAEITKIKYIIAKLLACNIDANEQKEELSSVEKITAKQVLQKANSLMTTLLNQLTQLFDQETNKNITEQSREDIKKRIEDVTKSIYNVITLLPLSNQIVQNTIQEGTERTLLSLKENIKILINRLQETPIINRLKNKLMTLNLLDSEETIEAQTLIKKIQQNTIYNAEWTKAWEQFEEMIISRQQNDDISNNLIATIDTMASTVDEILEQLKEKEINQLIKNQIAQLLENMVSFFIDPINQLSQRVSSQDTIVLLKNITEKINRIIFKILQNNSSIMKQLLANEQFKKNTIEKIKDLRKNLKQEKLPLKYYSTEEYQTGIKISEIIRTKLNLLADVNFKILEDLLTANAKRIYKEKFDELKYEIIVHKFAQARKFLEKLNTDIDNNFANITKDIATNSDNTIFSILQNLNETNATLKQLNLEDEITQNILLGTFDFSQNMIILGVDYARAIQNQLAKLYNVANKVLETLNSQYVLLLQRSDSFNQEADNLMTEALSAQNELVRQRTMKSANQKTEYATSTKERAQGIDAVYKQTKDDFASLHILPLSAQ